MGEVDDVGGGTSRVGVYVDAVYSQKIQPSNQGKSP